MFSICSYNPVRLRVIVWALRIGAFSFLQLKRNSISAYLLWGSSLVLYHQIRVLATVDIVSEVVVSRHYLDEVLQDTP